ncbi:hopanoid-associated sugar epimerase [Aureimonas leprariae]|uniref:NAD-dependent epimerase/dehydratase family protein n=1 Tax=Plantimonas leprariae TaxID=2615207 RepID=A0A7V7TX29_9HYPH|nr:hopanoid-associated sugar epimerase [Aureimonas leprariae]KAB0680643.1 NAD-dependent epimerase/dehydratase family protein [Aureimonas leprariae]
MAGRPEASGDPSPASEPGGIVAITGAGGFLGSALVRAFRDAGFAVRAMVRPASDRRGAELPGVELASGDVTDPASLAAVFDGARYVVHAAADYRLWTRDPAAMLRTNVEGTQHVMEAALRAGVERVVHTSSVATLRPPTEPGRRATEDDAASASEAVGVYKRSKVLAEAVALDYAAKGLDVVIVNPSTPIGPRDARPTPTGRIIIEAAGGRMPAFVDTGLNLAHVDDVAAGHLLALRRGRIGERYILGGEDVTLADMLAEIAARRGRRAPSLRLPVPALLPLAALAEGVARVTGREPFISFDALRMARKRMFFDDAKARAELGYRSRPWQEGIADALRWFTEAGRIA